jgi:hypothetical protein
MLRLLKSSLSSLEVTLKGCARYPFARLPVKKPLVFCDFNGLNWLNGHNWPTHNHSLLVLM